MKYITKEVRIGIAGIVALCVLIYGINWLKGIHMFQPSSYFYAKFENVNGLTKSSPVFADGVRVGIVRDIYYDYAKPGNVIVEVELDTELRIPKGSSAELISELMVFDKDGKFLFSQVEEGEALATGNYQMEVKLPIGEYQFLAWAGARDSYDIYTPRGENTITDMRLRLKREESLIISKVLSYPRPSPRFDEKNPLSSSPKVMPKSSACELMGAFIFSICQKPESFILALKISSPPIPG